MWTAALLLVALVWVGTYAATGGTLIPASAVDALLPAPRIAPSGHRVLLLSDEPEAVPGPGILYQDAVAGPFRVFLYAWNASSRGLVFSVVAANRGYVPIRLVLQRIGAGGPSSDDAGVAAHAEAAYFAPARPVRLTLAPGASVDLAQYIGVATAAPGQLVNAIVDGSGSGALTLSTVAEPRPDTPLAALGYLAAGRVPVAAMRGTFRHADYAVTVSGFGWQRVLRLPEGPGYVTGRSAIDGGRVRDYGNYGVLYRVHTSIYSGSRRTLCELLAIRAAQASMVAASSVATLPLAFALSTLSGEPVAPIPAIARTWQNLLQALVTQSSVVRRMPLAGTQSPLPMYVPT